MASHPSQPNRDLPVSSSPNLTLTNPTDAERVRTWTATHPQWGPALSLDGYLEREAHIMTLPLSRDGGMTQWILTDKGEAEPGRSGARPVLSSCDTLRKRALVSGPDGVVREGWAHGVASVFTYPELRGRGYAGRMMELLGEMLRRREGEKPGEAVFSVLYSDIGKNFYAARGWGVFESAHLEVPKSLATDSWEYPEFLKPIRYEELATYATLDEQILRKALESPSADSSSSSKTRVALIPDLDHLQWHLLREDFMCRHIFSRVPSTRGAVFQPVSSSENPPSKKQRVWAIWSRNFYGGAAHPEKNILSLLRFVVGDPDMSDEDLAEGIEAVLTAAAVEAGKWMCEKVEVWNPGERVKSLALGMEHLRCTFVEREGDSIASLNWFGDGGGAAGDGLEWLANEKFGWC